MLPREPRVGHAPHGPAGRQRRRHRRAPLGVLRLMAERLPDRFRDPAVAFGRQVQPVHVPQPRVGERGRAVQVDDDRPVPGGELVDAGEQLLHARPEPLQDGTLTARAAHQDELLARRGQLLDGLLQESAHPSHVALGPQRVVEPADQGDHVGLHGRRHVHLLVHDLPDQLAAHREVGVPEAGRTGRHPGGEQVGPAAVGTVGKQVRHALGEGVAERDEAAVGGVRVHDGGNTIPCTYPAVGQPCPARFLTPADRTAPAARPPWSPDRPAARPPRARPPGGYGCPASP